MPSSTLSFVPGLYCDGVLLPVEHSQCCAGGEHLRPGPAEASPLPTLSLVLGVFAVIVWCCLQNIANAVLGLDMEGQVLLEHYHSEYTLDIAVPALQLAIEADGPLHFMQNQPIATGRTLRKTLW